MIAACLSAAAALSPAGALAHPHVFAEATLEVEVAPDRTVQSLGHVWRFDDLFSATVLMEFDKDKDRRLDDAELAEVGRTVHDSLADFGYFQVVTADGKAVAMKAPDELIATYDDQQLVIMFESAPEKPLKLAGRIAFGIYDPTFYTAIDFTSDDMMKVNGMPADCRRNVVRPDSDEAIAQNQQSLTDAFFDDPTGTDYSKLFATRLELDCGGGK